MKISIISLTENGGRLSLKIAEKLPDFEVTRYCFFKYPSVGAETFDDLRELVGRVFHSSDALVFICACGIAVRVIAPLVMSKQTDPAVVVIDENGRFCVPILSGHLGGANALAKRIAEAVGALPVITTATDSGGKFSTDCFAKANGLIITDMTAAKEVAAAVLRGEKIGLCSDYPCANVPPELVKTDSGIIGIKISADTAESPFEKSSPNSSICRPYRQDMRRSMIGFDGRAQRGVPFETTLHLVPKNIVVGIGCKKNTPYELLRRRVRESLSEAGIDKRRICKIATIDIKSDEAGLIALCDEYGVSLTAYSAEELSAVTGDFSASDFVQSVTGVDNVCERAATLDGNRLVMRKNAADGVTVAAAECEIILDFEKDVL